MPLQYVLQEREMERGRKGDRDRIRSTSGSIHTTSAIQIATGSFSRVFMFIYGCMAHLILLLTSTAKLEVRTLRNSGERNRVEPLHGTAWLPLGLFASLVVLRKVYLKIYLGG